MLYIISKCKFIALWYIQNSLLNTQKGEYINEGVEIIIEMNENSKLKNEELKFKLLKSNISNWLLAADLIFIIIKEKKGFSILSSF